MEKSTLANKLFSQWDKSNSPGAAVSVMIDGEIIYKKGFGCANLEYDIPIMPSTIFHVASVSKQFTAMAILLLEKEGKLSIYDDVHKYIPELPDFGQTITIEHLIHHTSGLRDQWELLFLSGWREDDVITKEHIMKMITRQKALNFEPGTQFLYSNSGYTLMAEIVERVTGQTFASFTKEYIFKPLEMNNTHFHDDNDMIVKNRAYSYRLDLKDGFKKSVLNFSNVGATSLFTTVEDLSKWGENFNIYKVGGSSVINRMLQRYTLKNGETIPYACGVSIKEYKGLRTIEHNGADAGFRSSIVCFPDQKMTVSVLSNLSTFKPEYYAKKLAEIFLSDEISKKENNVNLYEDIKNTANDMVDCNMELSSEDLDIYTGCYYSEELDTYYKIQRQNNKLIVKHTRHSDCKLIPYNNDTFVPEESYWLNGDIKFIKNQGKQIIGFKLTSSRALNLWFSKRN